MAEFKNTNMNSICRRCKWSKPVSGCDGSILYCACDKPCNGPYSTDSQFSNVSCVSQKKDKRKYFIVVEETIDYIICHGTGLTWKEACSMTFEKMLDDCQTVDDNIGLNNVKIYDLECNDNGLGIEYMCDGNKVNYYMLDDPGRSEAE